MNYSLGGIHFEATEEGAGAFNCFNRAHPAADHSGTPGMVEEMETFIRITEGLRCLLDVGALFGIFSLVFTRNTDAVAYALEPSALAYPILVNHVEINPVRRIHPIQAFAGMVSGRPVSCRQVWKHIVPEPGDLICTETRIDDLHLEPDCIKIDVEGHEMAVLRGAESTIRCFRPIIFLEFHCASLTDGETVDSFAEFIASLEYECRSYEGKLVKEFAIGSMMRVLCLPKKWA